MMPSSSFDPLALPAPLPAMNLQSRQVPMDLKFVHPSDLHAYLERPYDPNIKLHSYPGKQLPKGISGYDKTYVPGDQAVVKKIIEPFLAQEEVVSVESASHS